MASGQRSQQSALARSLTEAIGLAIDETLTTIAEVTVRAYSFYFSPRLSRIDICVIFYTHNIATIT